MTFVAEASELLAGTLDPNGILALTAQMIVPRVATWCAAYTEDGERPVYVWHTDEDLADALTERLVQEGAPPEGPPQPWIEEIACTVPLIARGRRLGAIAVGRPDRFPIDYYELAEELARRSALALDNARLYGLQKATSLALQRSLLPRDPLPQPPWVEFAVSYHPAGEGAEVGGDFYDVFEVPPGPDGVARWRFAIGDVCGTGPEAAAVTGLARHALRILGGEGMALADVMERLNRLIIDEGDRGRLLTLLHGEIAETGDLSMICAGHPLPLILSTDATIEEGTHPQPLLGVLDEVTFTASHRKLLPGQVLLAVTDGVTERRCGERMLGDGTGLEKVLASCAGLNAGAIAAAVERAVQDFSPEPGQDDVAIVVLRATG
ncbi:SpoIIE family protein phosphatase [Actinocorallia longicatena]